MYWALVSFFGFVALPAAAMIFGGPESSAHVVYGSAVVFVAASAGLIVSTVLAVRLRAQEKLDRQFEREQARTMVTGQSRREVGG
jgi:hypothetical protein